VQDFPSISIMANMAKRIDVSEKAQHRKIDVDAYDEDRYVDDEVVDTSADAAVNGRATEVKGLLAKGNTKDAVLKALENPPFNSQSQDIKVTFTTLFSSSFFGVLASRNSFGLLFPPSLGQEHPNRD